MRERKYWHTLIALVAAATGSSAPVIAATAAAIACERESARDSKWYSIEHQHTALLAAVATLLTAITALLTAVAALLSTVATALAVAAATSTAVATLGRISACCSRHVLKGHTTTAATEASTAATAGTLRRLVDTNGATVEPGSEWLAKHRALVNGCAHSMLFMLAIAASASESEAKRTKPKPRLRPVSRSLTTICADQLVKVAWMRVKSTYSLLDLTELLELLAQGLVVGVPCEATVIAC